MNPHIRSSYHLMIKFVLPGISVLAILSLLLAGCSSSTILQTPTPPRLVLEPEAINRQEARLAQMTQDSSSEVAKLYDDHVSTIERQVGSPPVSEGSGQMYSSAEDLFLLDQALYTDQLMPESELDRILETYLSKADNAGLGHGTSWITAGGGEGSPLATFIVQSPQVRLTVIALINQGMIDLFNIWDLIKNELF